MATLHLKSQQGLKAFEVNSKISYHGSDKKSDVQKLPMLVQELSILQNTQEAEPNLVPVPVQNLPNYDISKDFEGIETSTSIWTQPRSSRIDPMHVSMTASVGRNLRKRRDEDVKFALYEKKRKKVASKCIMTLTTMASVWQSPLHHQNIQGNF